MVSFGRLTSDKCRLFQLHPKPMPGGLVVAIATVNEDTPLRLEEKTERNVIILPPNLLPLFSCAVAVQRACAASTAVGGGPRPTRTREGGRRGKTAARRGGGGGEFGRRPKKESLCFHVSKRAEINFGVIFPMRVASSSNLY